MKWSLSQLKKYMNQTLTLDENVQFEQISNRSDVVSIGDTSVTGEMSVRATRISFDLYIDTTLIMLDSRTIEEISVPLSIQSTEIFDEMREPDDDSNDNIHFVDHTIDLTPIVRELIVINIPTKFTKSDSVNITGGKNWSVISEDDLDESSREETVDPRLSKLQSLFSDVEEEK